MSFFGFLLLLLIAAICGGIGQSISGYSFGGCLISAGVGFIGAIIGKWIASELGLPELWTIEISGSPFPIIWSIIGAALFTAILGAVMRGKEKAL
ncbi:MULTISPECIES: GlsB/YeaQ/YmgE family stress response membrane protein [unclassified Gracilimonas]|uniref:GlsB/YeaQ/YmgE family stress response membrane protein n=1 Tax=unclassified Gracilimonas TaxID=2644176 RepID=UPI0032D93D94